MAKGSREGHRGAGGRGALPWEATRLDSSLICGNSAHHWYARARACVCEHEELKELKLLL